jgi:hypothetical protein
MTAVTGIPAVEDVAALLWLEAGAVIPWERAAPVVQERYREQARCKLATIFNPLELAALDRLPSA